MAAGGGGDEAPHAHVARELSILESSPGVIAVIMGFFLVTTLGLELFLHKLRAFLSARRKLGLLAAVNHLASELMLLAVASLVLTAIEPRLEGFCLPTHNSMRPWVYHVRGCACCLARTHGISTCFLQDRSCPAELEGICEHRSHASDRLVLPAAFGEEVFGFNATDAPVCEGPTQSVWPECKYREGYAPIVTSETVEQIHMFLFIVTVTHIAVGIVALVLSTLKLRVWSSMAGTERGDPRIQLAQRGREMLAAKMAAGDGSLHKPYHSAAAAPAGAIAGTAGVEMQPLAGQGPLSTPDLERGGSGRMRGSSSGGGGGRRAVSFSLTGSSGGGAPAGNPPTQRSASAGAAAVGRSPLGSAGGAAGAADAGAVVLARLPPHLRQRRRRRGGSFNGAAADDEGTDTDGTVDAHTTVATEDDTEREDSPSGDEELGEGPEQTGQSGSTMGQSEISAPSFWGSGDRISSIVVEHQGAPWRGRPEHVVGVLAWVKEAAIMLLRHLHPLTITAEEYRVMRASFHLAHDTRGPNPVDGVFRPYLAECLERDGSKVVGLGWVTWGFIIAFVLLSGAVGWVAWIFVVAAGGLLFYLNSFLIYTLRRATAGGAIRAFEATGFWERRRHAALLLPLIKLLLFMLSFVVSNAFFFSVYFGRESCFFSRTGFQKNPVSWWVVMAADVGMIFSVSLVTLPLYGLLAHVSTLNRAVLRNEHRLERVRRSTEGGGAGSSEGGRRSSH